MSFGEREITIETGRMARQASGSVIVKYGDTMVLVTATSDFVKDVEQDFFPLQCEYRERTYAAGKIPGGFFKREGRPSEKEILSSRLIDRPIRPLFPEGFFYDTQIIAYVISSDQENSGDILGIIGASAALSISTIPFLGPIGGVRVGLKDNQFILNPTIQEVETSELDIVIAGTEESVIMVEGEAKEISENKLIDAIQFGHEAIVKVINLQEELIDKIKPEKYNFETPKVPYELEKLLVSRVEEMLPKWRELAKVSKKARSDSIAIFIKSISEEFSEQYPDESIFIAKQVDELLRKDMRNHIVKTKIRLDGRDFTDIRPITCEVGVLPRAHGSALFTRGETQSLGSVTLGTKLDEQIVDDIDREEFSKRFMLHYNFPPFCVGEVRPIRGVGRREIGHGNLAERALKTQIPPEEVFPYTIRIVSDILESNGSSSMASVCAGSLALMDAGIPVEKTIAGIAMGLIKEDNQFIILSDILGIEDYYGDMDFKITGTREGITAIQMDLKVKGISTEVMLKALEQARKGRLEIIDIMESVIKEPRAEISKYAPKMLTMKINVDYIGDVIGPGGKNVKSITAETGATIEISDDGTVFISAPNAESGEKAKALIENIVEQPEEGKIYNGSVKRLESYGAFVEFLPGKEGLLHVSEVAWTRTPDIKQVLKVGDNVKVKLKKIASPGRYELSMRELIEKPVGYKEKYSDKSRSRYNDKEHSNNYRKPRNRY